MDLCRLVVKDRCLEARWELRLNAVWRHGQLFLRCPHCNARVTRLYLIDVRGVDSLACRTCWGLTDESRATRTYRDTQWGRGDLALLGPLACTQREWAYMETDRERERRADACAERWAYRRRLLRA